MAGFQRATREKSRLRLALDGPAGAGKSFTLLSWAFALAGKDGKVAAIETEHRSLAKYAGDAPHGTPWEFDMNCLDQFSPTEYTQAIEEAGRAGYAVLIIDSLSHAWEGKDGALELVDRKVAGSNSKNSFAAWKDVTPLHRRMVEAILASPCHVLCSMRSKVEYVMEEDSRGKKTPRKIGMAPIQRQGMEYEFDIYGSMDWDHTLTISKSRCPAVDGAVIVKPGPQFMVPIISWLETGTAPVAPPTPQTNGHAARPNPEPGQPLADYLRNADDKAVATGKAVKGELRRHVVATLRKGTALGENPAEWPADRVPFVVAAAQAFWQVVKARKLPATPVAQPEDDGQIASHEQRNQLEDAIGAQASASWEDVWEHLGIGEEDELTVTQWRKAMAFVTAGKGKVPA